MANSIFVILDPVALHDGLHAREAVGPSRGSRQPEDCDDDGEAKVHHRGLFVLVVVDVGEEYVEDEDGHGGQEGDDPGEDKELRVCLEVTRGNVCGVPFAVTSDKGPRLTQAIKKDLDYLPTLNCPNS